MKQPTKKKLKEQFDIFVKSTNWWEGEVNKIIAEYDELEAQLENGAAPFGSDLHLKIEEAFVKLSHLVARGKVEIAGLDGLQKKINEYEAKRKKKKG